MLPELELNEFMNLIVEGPKKPVPLDNPDGVSTWALYLFWNLIKAAFVDGPNFSVSFPNEPEPELVIGKPFLFRNCCRLFTDEFLSPSLRDFVKL